MTAPDAQTRIAELEAALRELLEAEDEFGHHGDFVGCQICAAIRKGRVVLNKDQSHATDKN